MDTIFSVVLLLFVAISVLWSVFVRKLAKTRIKSVLAIASVFMALIGTVIIKTTLVDPSFVQDTILPQIPSLPAMVMDLINGSDLLLEFAIGVPAALISPLIFVVLYIAFAILTNVIYLLVIIIAGRAIRKSNKKNLPYAKARSFAWSAISAFIVLLVVLVPVTFYGSLADDVVDFIADVDQIDDETQGIIEELSENYIKPITEGTTVELFRAVGGDMLIDEITSFTVDGDVVYIKSELNSIMNVASNVLPLTKDGAPTSYGEEEANSLVAAVKHLTNSKLLTTLASQAVVLLTEDMVNGEESVPMADNEMFGGLITKVVTIVHEDARNSKKFKSDLTTVAKMASELIKGGVFANMDNTDVLLEELAGGSTIKNVILVLGENSSMKCLIPEVTNIGIQAIANAVGVQEDATALYNDLMGTIASDLESVKGLDDAEKVNQLSPKLTEAFDNAGIAIDKQVINLYSVAMIQGIVNEAGEDAIAAEDVQSFFAAYAASASQIGTPSLIEDVDNETVNSAPAILARMIYNLSAQDVKSEGFNKEDVASMLDTEAQAMLGTNEGALYEAIVGVTLKKNLDTLFVDTKVDSKYSYAIQQKFYTTSTFENTVALQSAETMKERSLLIFMDEVIVDVDNVGDFDAKVEADAIGGIFSQAGSLMNDLSGEINIGTMATSVGNILNSLRDSESVGEERTTNLFVAIIQSSMVRDAANMDIGTATQLGVKGTAKNADGTPVDYAKTFKTISNTMDVLQNMNSSTEEGMNQADLSVVLKDLNQQTAGMIESYITEERLSEDYGLDAEQSSTAAPIISDVFGYMGSADMTEEECAKEAEALTDVMNLVTSASDKVTGSEAPIQSVFGDENSVLGKDAAGTVETFMSSESIKHSLNNNADKLGEDAFGMQEMLQQDEAKNEKQELEDAMKNYYETTEYETEEEKAADKETLTNLGKLFGFTSDEMKYILGE